MDNELSYHGNQTNRAVRAMESKAVRSLLERLTELELQVLRQPETGLVMMTVSDCFTTDFHLGEVVVTTAEVCLEDRCGWGMIMGDEADRALLLAVLDALPQDDSSPLHDEIDMELSYWLKRATANNDNDRQLAAATRVNFENMTPED